MDAQTSDKLYGAFRVVRDGVILKSGRMNESEATDLAQARGGHIEHQNPETGEWKEW